MSSHIEQLKISPAELKTIAKTIIKEGSRFQMAYLHETDPEPELIYLVDQGPSKVFLQIIVSPVKNIPSLAHVAPLLSWYEREIMDFYDIVFLGHPEPHPLIALEGLRLPRSKAGSKYTNDSTTSEVLDFMARLQVEQPQIQDLFWGPVRGDIVETGEFHFAYIGEAILHYQPRLFYKHRGIETTVRGLSPLMALNYIERISGISSITHSLAFCLAVEDALKIQVPKRAQFIRVALAELERIYNNLHYFSLLCKTTTLKVGESFGSFLEEQAKQLNAILTGNRFLRNVITIGGIKKDLNLASIETGLSKLSKDASKYLDSLANTQSHLDRLIGTGVLSKEIAFDFGATGPVANASGLERDLRLSHPYTSYDDLKITVDIRTDGDALARSQVRATHLIESFKIVKETIEKIAPEEILTKQASINTQSDTDGIGWALGPRGTCIHAVYLQDNRIKQLKIKSASFSNWKVFPQTVNSSNMMDYAINEASFGLTIAGYDR